MKLVSLVKLQKQRDFFQIFPKYILFFIMLKKCLNVNIRFMLFYYILTFKFINVCINFDDNIGFVKCQNLWSETLEIYETSELSENNETTETQWYNAKQFGWQRALISHVYEVVISCYLMLDGWRNDGAVTQRQLPIIFAPTAQVPVRSWWVRHVKQVLHPATPCATREVGICSPIWPIPG